MSPVPFSETNWRSPRVGLADMPPAVLRLPDGGQHRGKLETVSLTGGLLSMPNPLQQGSGVRLLFLTQQGPVLGSVEMLSPVSTNQQPFRFVAMDPTDRRRLRAVVESFSEVAADAWIEKYRAAVQRDRPQRHFFRFVFRCLTVLTLLGSVAYLLEAHLLR
jgi:hypothetical protein